MTTGRAFVENFLAHYSSPYYNPQKAHEYYIRTRQLHPRHSTKGFDQKQKEGFSYVSNQVATKKKADLKGAMNTHAAAVKQARDQAASIRQDLSTKLKAVLQQISDQAKADSASITADSATNRKTIADKLAADIAAVPAVPKGLPAAQRAKLQQERSDKIAALRGQASSDRAALSTSTANARLSERTSASQTRDSSNADASAQRQKVGDDLKAAIANFDAQYKAAKAQIVSRSAATLDKEYANIKNKVR